MKTPTENLRTLPDATIHVRYADSQALLRKAQAQFGPRARAVVTLQQECQAFDRELRRRGRERGVTL